jgi:hypothetical protein
MRLRLGLLQDPAAIDRQIAREAAEIEARRKALKQDANKPTVLTEEETKAEKNLTDEDRKKIEEKIKAEEKSKTARRIRPLTEAKAIDSGANFISEAFLFCVAGGLLVFEAFRSRRKEATRQRGVEERLGDLEEEVSGIEGERETHREGIEARRELEERVQNLEEEKRRDEERIDRLEKYILKTEGDLPERKLEDSPMVEDENDNDKASELEVEDKKEAIDNTSSEETSSVEEEQSPLEEKAETTKSEEN